STYSPLTIPHPVLPFFSFIFRPPPTSTLFPYTTLFRSFLRPLQASGGGCSRDQCMSEFPKFDGEGRLTLRSGRRMAHTPAARERSEEHTSELQSHLNLVCRLLLEKKKKNKMK